MEGVDVPDSKKRCTSMAFEACDDDARKERRCDELFDWDTIAGECKAIDGWGGNGDAREREDGEPSEAQRGSDVDDPTERVDDEGEGEGDGPDDETGNKDDRDGGADASDESDSTTDKEGEGGSTEEGDADVDITDSEDEIYGKTAVLRTSLLGKIFRYIFGFFDRRDPAFEWVSTPESPSTWTITDLWILFRNDVLVRGFFDEGLARSRMEDYANALCADRAIKTGTVHTFHWTGRSSGTICSTTQSIIPVRRTEDVVRIVNTTMEVSRHLPRE